MGVCAIAIAIVLGGAFGTSATSNTRNHSVLIAANGNIEISDSFVASTLRQTSSLVRNQGANPKDSLGTYADDVDKTNTLDKSSLIRKHGFPAQDTSDGNIATSDDLDDLAIRQVSLFVRSVGVDAKGNIETDTDNRDKVSAFEKASEIVAARSLAENDGQVQFVGCYDALENTTTDEGNNLESIPHESLDDCKASCTNTDGCHSFVVCPHEPGMCLLKDRALDSNAVRKVVGVCKSYYKVPCPASAKMWPVVGGGRGPDEDELRCSVWRSHGDGSCGDPWQWRNNETTLVQCQAECVKYANCKGISFNDNAGSRSECIMMGNLPTNGITNLSWKSYMKPASFLVSTAELFHAGSKPVATLSEDRTSKNVQSVYVETTLHADPKTQYTPILVRKTASPDASRSASIVSFVEELATSSDRDAALRSMATVLQKSVDHFGYAAFFSFTFMFFFFTMVGFLGAAVLARRDFLDQVARERGNEAHAVPVSVRSTKSKRAPAGSDGESESSTNSSTEPPSLPWNRRSSHRSRFVVRTGLVWKLERRFIDDLTSHSFSSFDSTDRFTFLESWDLRFFSLDVDAGAVILSYVSELKEFKPVVIEIKSIESDIMTIGSLRRMSASRAKKHTKGPLIGYYGKYLERLRRIGYKTPEGSTHDPQNLFVFIVSGIRQGEIANSRHVGRIKWLTSEGHKDKDTDNFLPLGSGQLSRMCLGCARNKDCKRWHDEIALLLKKMAPTRQNLSRRRTSDLAERVRQDALEQFEAKSASSFESSSASSCDGVSSFQLDARAYQDDLIQPVA